MGKSKINMEELAKWEPLLRSGEKSVAEATKHFKVSGVGLWRARGKLKAATAKVTVLEAGHKILTSQINVMDQLANSNNRISEISDELMEAIQGKKKLDIKGTKDIRVILKEFEKERREQIRLQMDILKTLHSVKDVSDFQQTILHVIGNANKCPECGEDLVCSKCGEKIDLRSQAIKKLKEARALRSGVEIRP